jgi:hypothetical protein
MPCAYWMQAAGVFHIGGAALDREAERDRLLFALIARRLDESKRIPQRDMEALIELFNAYART